MKIARFGKGQVGVVDGDDVVDVTEAAGVDVAGVAAGRAEPADRASATSAARPSRPRSRPAPASRSPTRGLLTPVPWPNKVIAYPVNYHDHGREMQAGYRADVQGFFLKPPSSLSGAEDAVELPAAARPRGAPRVRARPS